MAIICPQCSLENPDPSTFCRRCGAPLAQAQTSESASGNPGQFYVPPADSVIQQGFPAPSAPLSYPQVQSQDVMFTPLNAAPPAPSIPIPTQLGKRAFAGYGMPVSRASWLITDQQMQANDLLTATRDELTKRGLPGLTINQPRLSERSFMVEKRDYLTAHRGSASTFVYIAPAGRDLYISRTTTAQTPISLVRVATLILFLILMIIGLAQSSSPPTGSSLGTAFSTILINFSYPLLLFFCVLIVASLVAWPLHGDAGMYLRPATLNDFQMDDAALLEESVDSSLRSAAQTAGVDTAKFATRQGDRVRRRIRWI